MALEWVGTLARRSAGLLLLLAAAAQTAHAEGAASLQSVDTGARTVTLDHEDIPGFMKGMTMTFHLAPGVELTGIAQGAEVDFRVKEERGVYTVTEIRRTGP